MAHRKMEIPKIIQRKKIRGGERFNVKPQEFEENKIKLNIQNKPNIPPNIEKFSLKSKLNFEEIKMGGKFRKETSNFLEPKHN